MSGEDHLRKRSNAGDTCCRASPRVASGSEREAAATQQEAERKCYLEVKSCCENQQELIQEINLSPGTTPWEECRRGQGDKPIVFRGNASSWKSAKWTPESMAGNDVSFGRTYYSTSVMPFLLFSLFPVISFSGVSQKVKEEIHLARCLLELKCTHQSLIFLGSLFFLNIPFLI